MATTDAIQVTAEVEVEQTSKDLVNLGLQTEQQIRNGQLNISVLVDEKRDEVADLMEATRDRVRSLAADIEKAKDEFNSCTCAARKVLSKKTKSIGSTIFAKVTAVALSALQSKVSSVVGDGMEIDEEGTKKDGGITVEVSTRDRECHVLKVKLGSYNSTSLSYTQKFDTKTAKVLEKLEKLERLRSEAVAYGDDLSKMLGAVDKYERKLTRSLNMAAINTSEEAKANLEKMRKVLFPATIPQLPWSGK